MSTPIQPMGVSPDDAARLIGISTSTFYKEVMPLVHGGKIQSTKIGRRRIILVESLMTWLREKARSEKE
jgi:excisionase family DNA binding protein